MSQKWGPLCMKLQLEEKKYIIFHYFFPPSKNTKECECMEALLHYIRYGLIFDRKYIYAARMIQELKYILLDLNCHNTVQLNTKAQPLYCKMHDKCIHSYVYRLWRPYRKRWPVRYSRNRVHSQLVHWLRYPFPLGTVGWREWCKILLSFGSYTLFKFLYGKFPIYSQLPVS